MIIVCPDCSKPYELPDNQISALVQIACPHCAHAVILDFEAANDPSLQEAGHRVTSGFLSRQDYMQSLETGAQAPAANRAPVAPATPAATPSAPAAKTTAPKTESKRSKPTSLGIGPKAKAAPKPTPVPAAKPEPAPAPVAAKPATPKPVTAPPVPATPAARSTTPPPAHPAPPAPPGTRSSKQRPRPPAPVAPPAAAKEAQPPVRASAPSPKTPPDSKFPQLGPGFGEAAPELPPMRSSAAGNRPHTVTIDLNRAALGENIYKSPGEQPSTPLAAASLPREQELTPEHAAAGQSAPPSLPAQQETNLQAAEGQHGNEATSEQAQEQAMQATISDAELEPVKKGMGWFWWILALLLLAGGGVWGWTMMQQSEHAGSDPTLGAP